MRVASLRTEGGDDRLLVLTAEGRTVIAVADGAGGTGSGARAAQQLTELVRGHMNLGPIDPPAILRTADVAMHAAGHGGETTAVLAVMTREGVQGASVGDSEAWLVNEHDVIRLTERQHRKPLLGTRAAVAVPFRTALDGTLVVATDGLFKYAPWARIAEIVRSTAVEGLPERLLEVVRLPTGGLQDDVAIVVAARGATVKR